MLFLYSISILILMKVVNMSTTLSPFLVDLSYLKCMFDNLKVDVVSLCRTFELVLFKMQHTRLF